MWKNIRQQAKLDKCDYLLYYPVEAGAFLVGLGIMLCARRFGNEDSCFLIGTLVAGICAVAMYLLGLGLNMYMGYGMAVSMGKTRRGYLMSSISVNLLTTFLGALLLEGLMRLEFAVYRHLYPTIAVGGSSLLDVSLFWAAAGAVLLTGTASLACAVMRRSKRWGGAVLLLLWLLCCWSIPGVFGKQDSFLSQLGGTVGRLFGGFAEPVQLAMATGAGILFIVLACAMMWRLEVE